ncbi:MAG: hypothetical protein ACE5F9_05490 [Phycisphaerae bacterium]
MGLLSGLLLAAAAGGAIAQPGGGISWVETFADDPLAAGRFAVGAGQDGARFSYDAVGQFLTVHYDTILPTAWYQRPLDPAGGRVLGRYDDFDFFVTFRIRSGGFFADPNGFAQIAWGLLSSQTTGEDRAGGSSGPFAFDVVSFDYFPNVTAFGGPTLGPTVVHGDDGSGFFANIDFTFGAETDINTTVGDENLALDVMYTAHVAYRGADQTATVMVSGPAMPMLINADGAGGPGGFDGDPTTIQTLAVIDRPFTVDRFALMAWQDTFSPFGSSIIADVDIHRIAFSAPPVLVGDVNLDGHIDGMDIEPFVTLLLSGNVDPSLAARGDFDGDGVFDIADRPGFVAALLQ